jgi:hypothetical protein
VLPGVLWALGSVAAVFFSHPDESNIVDKISATNVERNVVFMGLTSSKLSGAEGVRCSEGLDSRLPSTRRVHITNHGSNRNRNGDNDADPDEHAIPWPTG